MRKKMYIVLSVALALFTVLLQPIQSVFVFSNAFAAEPKTISDYENGDILEFGWYPQTEVLDDELIDALNQAEAVWQSYGYYSGTGNAFDGEMTASDYYKYTDVFYNGEKYRGVTFTHHRPTNTGYALVESEDSDAQYKVNQIYWFKYEPIKWIVLDQTLGVCISVNVLDAQTFTDVVWLKDSTHTGGLRNYYTGSKTYPSYANEYSSSSLEKWIGNTFRNTSFSSTQKDIITTGIPQGEYLTTGDNSIAYRDYYVGVSTDYARSQQLSFDENGASHYWTSKKTGDVTTLGGECGRYARIISNEGTINSRSTVNDIRGVRPYAVFSANQPIVQTRVIDINCDHKNTTSTEQIAPTCTAIGYTEGVLCQNCGNYVSGHEVIPAINHANAYSTDAVAETCTTVGYTAGVYCPDCETWLEGHEVIPATNHANAYATDAVAETCTTVGYTAGRYCPDCNTYIEGHNLIPATNHANAYSIEVVAATCTTVGYTAGVYCPDCKLYIEGHNEIPALKHNYQTTVVNPTCTEQGYTLHKCTRCMDEYKTDYQSALGHHYVETSITPSTCRHTGEIVHKCTGCGTTYTETLPITDHQDNNHDGHCDACNTVMENSGGNGDNHSGNNKCPWCGKVHTGFFAGIIRFFHNIMYRIAKIFGLR